MNLIDDIDFVLCLIRFKSCPFYQLSYIIDSRIRCSIDLDDIEEGIIIESFTATTFMAWISIFLIETIQCFSEYTSTCGFARSTRSMKEIGVVDSSSFETIS